MEKVRFGIIGLGNMGTFHAENFKAGKIEKGVVTALCDINPKRREELAEKYPETKIFEKAEDLIGSGLVDAIIIATPHYFHPEYAIKGLNAGLHVLTEKPAGVYTKAVLEMNEVAKKQSKVFGIMFNQRTNPVYAKVREMVQSGELGKIQRIEWTITNWFRTQAYYDSSSWRSTWDGEGGGALINQNPHQLDLWQWMFGMPSKLWAHMSFGRYHDIEVEDDVNAYMEYENGTTGIYITSTGECPGTNRLEVAADAGRLVVENNELYFEKNPRLVSDEIKNSTEIFSQMPNKCEKIKIDVPSDGGAQHCGILNNYVEAILNGTPLLAPGIEGINGLTLSNSMHYSAFTGKMADVKNFPHDEFLALLTEKRKTSRTHIVEEKHTDTHGTFGTSKR